MSRAGEPPEAAHVGPEELQALRARQLPPARLLAIDRHARECAACRDALAAGASPRDPFAAPPTPQHLDYDRLAGYLRETLPPADREAAAAHLAACPQCTGDLQELAAFERAPRPPEAVEQPRPRRGPSRLVFATLGALAAAVPLGLLWYGAAQQHAAATREAGELRAGLALREREVASLRQQLAAERREPPETAPPEPNGAPKSTPGSGAQPRGAPGPRSPRPESLLVDGGGSLWRDEAGKLTREVVLPAEVQEVLRSGVLELPRVLAALQTEPEVERGTPPGEYVLLREPVGRVVLSDRPQVRWEAVPGAVDYQAVVVDAGTGADHASGWIRGTTWTTPPLPRGRTYTWQVTARLEGERVVESAAPRPRFRVLDRAAFARLEAMRRRHAGSPLTMGVLYAREGLLVEAERELRALREQNPKSALAEKLLRTVVHRQDPDR